MGHRVDHIHDLRDHRLRYLPVFPQTHTKVVQERRQTSRAKRFGRSQIDASSRQLIQREGKQMIDEINSEANVDSKFNDE